MWRDAARLGGVGGEARDDDERHRQLLAARVQEVRRRLVEGVVVRRVCGAARRRGRQAFCAHRRRVWGGYEGRWPAYRARACPRPWAAGSRPSRRPPLSWRRIASRGRAGRGRRPSSTRSRARRASAAPRRRRCGTADAGSAAARSWSAACTESPQTRRRCATSSRRRRRSRCPPARRAARAGRACRAPAVRGRPQARAYLQPQVSERTGSHRCGSSVWTHNRHTEAARARTAAGSGGGCRTSRRRGPGPGR